MASTGGLTVLAIGIGLVAASVGVWLAAARRQLAGPVVVGCVLLAGATATALVTFGVVGTVLADLFVIAHLWYLVAVISVPLAGMGLLVAGARDRTRPTMVVAGGVLLVPALVGAYATHVAPFQLEVDRVQLAVDPARAGARPLRIAVLADIQTPSIGDHERRAIDEVMATEPDVILIAGDFFQGSRAQWPAAREGFRELLGRLQAPGGVYAVEGDVDQWSSVAELVEGTEVEVLTDEVATAIVDGVEVVVGGLRLEWNTDEAQGVVRELEAAPDDQLAVLLAHRPDAVLGLGPDSRIDLTVAGHTHGGQIALPLLGPPMTLSEVPRDVGAGGLHEVDGNPIYVSTGVGLERGSAPQVRLGTRPSIGVVDVVAA